MRRIIYPNANVVLMTAWTDSSDPRRRNIGAAYRIPDSKTPKDRRRAIKKTVRYAVSEFRGLARKNGLVKISRVVIRLRCCPGPTISHVCDENRNPRFTT